MSVEPELGEHLARRRELRLAAVDDHEVGPLAETAVGHALGRESAAQHLAHHRDVVGLAGVEPHLEAAVALGVGAAVGEHDHRADRLLAVQRRDVVALDAQRRCRQRERALELQERGVEALLVVARADLEAHERVARVVLGEVEEVAALGSLRDGEPDAGGALGAHGRQPLLDRLGVFGQLGQDDLARDVGRVGVVAQQEAVDELGQRHVEALVEHELVAEQHAALAHRRTGARRRPSPRERSRRRRTRAASPRRPSACRGSR